MWSKNWNSGKDERGCGGPVLRDPMAQKDRGLPYDINTKFRANVPQNAKPRNSPSRFRGPSPRKPVNNFDTPPQRNVFGTPSGPRTPLISFGESVPSFPPTHNHNQTHFPPAFGGPNAPLQPPPSLFSGPPPSNPNPGPFISPGPPPSNPGPFISFPPPPINPFAGNPGLRQNFHDQTNLINQTSNQQFFGMPANNSVIPSHSIGFGCDMTMTVQNPSTPSPAPKPLAIPEDPVNNSIAVFTNDQQPPFAFPDNSPVSRNPKQGYSTSNRLLQLAHGTVAVGKPTFDRQNSNNETLADSNSFPSTNSTFPESSANWNTKQQNSWQGPERPIGVHGGSDSPGLLPNPFFSQKSLNKTANRPPIRQPANRGQGPDVPDWLRDDDDDQLPFMGKKKQNFDWKGSSFLKRLNNAPTSHNSTPIRAITPSPNANNVHTKSCVNNWTTFKNGNVNPNQNLKQVPMGRTPLLPTPKLIPYPPPPLPKKTEEPVSRIPKSILKPQPSYCNFVREGAIPADDINDENVSVVPYDDDDDGIEFVAEVVGKDSTKSTTDTSHDFFSEKIVNHFSSTLAGKPIESQLDGFLHYLVLSPDFLNQRVSIVRSLHVILSERFQKCSLHPYGADFIGIGNSDDSVNIFVDLNGKHGSASSIDGSNIEASALTKENVDDLLSLIQEDKRNKFFGQIVRRTNFNYYRRNLPVISFIHGDTKVRCNIRLDNYLLVQEAKVLQFICSLDTRLPPLLALLRYWSSVHKVLDTPEEDTKNRFATLLMLFFLAQKKIIPTMAHIQSLSIKKEYFENMDISFCDDISLVPQNENSALDDKAVFTLSTLSLLKQFFVMFASAKLEEDVVSLWNAEFIPKENFSPDVEGKVLPPELRKRYRYGANGQLREKRIDCGSLLCVQDFQDLTENLSLAVAEYDVKKFQIECGIAHKKIDEIIIGSGNLMDLFVVTEYADGDSTKTVNGFLRKVEESG